MMRRLRAALPAGQYPVRVDGVLDLLIVRYDETGAANIRLASRPVYQSEPIPLTKSGQAGLPFNAIARNISYGLDSALQLVNDKLVLTNTVVRGNEKTIMGLDRQDISLEIDLYNGPISTLFINEQVTNWSIYRSVNNVTSRRTRVELIR
jgi:hypothetical protein